MTRETIIHVAATIFVASAVALIIAGLYWALREQNEPPRECKAVKDARAVVREYLMKIGATL